MVRVRVGVKVRVRVSLYVGPGRERNVPEKGAIPMKKTIPKTLYPPPPQTLNWYTHTRISQTRPQWVFCPFLLSSCRHFASHLISATLLFVFTIVTTTSLYHSGSIYPPFPTSLNIISILKFFLTKLLSNVGTTESCVCPHISPFPLASFLSIFDIAPFPICCRFLHRSCKDLIQILT